jgi:preprotein translocase subunit SecD
MSSPGADAPPPVRRRRLWLGIGIAVAVVVVAGVGIALRVATGGTAEPAASPQRAALVAKLTVRTVDGRVPSSVMMEHFRQVLLSRLHAAGAERPEVSAHRSDVTVSAGGLDEEQLRQLMRRSDLAFRRVLASVPDQPARAQTPNGSCAAGGRAARDAALASAKAKLGAAYQVAENIQDPARVDEATLARLAAFATLTCAELSALPAAIHLAVPLLTCDRLDARDPDTVADPNRPVTACDRNTGQRTKYHLDRSAVRDVDVVGADAQFDPTGGWTVHLRFGDPSKSRWTALTREVVDSGAQPPRSQVAIVVDDEVRSAPQITGVVTGDAVISGGGLDEAAAKTLAIQLRYGALPFRAVVRSIAPVR